MKIERLTLHGFKSFADRTEIHFDRGVTGIIGPNGSGKSNVVEAIRFVLGSRARALRAREAEALIFHGGEGRKPMPFAEVELVLRDGRERYVVLRRIDRAGEQEVRLNGKRASFRQIERALAGSGLGKNAHALVGQGEISLILESTPDALLERLEEAAGLRVVTLSLRETRQRLERARQHLDALRELYAARLAEKARLEAEAEEARRAEALARERLEVQRGLVEARRRALEAEIEKLRARIEALTDERERLEEALREDEAAARELVRERDAARERLARLRAEQVAIESELKLLGRERGHLREALERLRAEAARLREENESLQRMREPLPPEPPGEADEADRLEERAARLREALRALEERLQRERAAFERARSRYQAYREALVRYEAELAAYRQAQQERARWSARLEELSGELARAEARLKQARGRAGELRKRLEAAQREVSDLYAETRALEREAGRLEALVASGADLGAGARELLRAKLPGVLGVVVDLLEVPEGYEVAAEAALGPRAQWVLLEDEAALRRAVAHLKKVGARATLLARDLARPRTTDLAAFAGRPGVLGPARELFRIPGEPRLTQALFGDTLLVESLEVALELARGKRRVRTVTLEGEVVEVLGSVSGGLPAKKSGARLELRGRLRRLAAERRHAQEALERARRRVEELKRALAELGLDALDEEVRRLRAERAAAERALAALPAAQAAPEPPEAVSEPDGEPLERFQRELADLTERLEEAERALADWRAYRTARERYELELEHYRERRARLERNLGRLGQIEEESRRLQARLEELEAQAREQAEKLEALGVEAARRALEELEERLAELERAQRERSARLGRIAGEAEEARVLLARREATLEEVLREAGELPPGPHAEGSVRKLQLRLREIERELEAIGPVNHRAAQALAELMASLGEVEASVAEAEAAAARLAAEAEQLREAYEAQLRTAFGRFRERFAYYGRALLGGMADVRLEEDGLHLSLQPQGKRTRDLRLLSTGEKTMGALGFLFALAEVGEGSLPIAVLDEVDAPLDESNILRFIGFLRDFARERQFILVTHQKRSMEACDVLWGVTNRGGASQVYSLRREEVES
ncbi:chromosome segregation SMC family protein [Oceanithermus sp.]|uniref:AAA family ATPase n=1 Tax=Oceanithermus sp. TaxID=2268145 RepID=UPI0025F399FE|nr:chromosome segregation SMC family protein [Oceanithermus sp.]